MDGIALQYFIAGQQVSNFFLGNQSRSGHVVLSEPFSPAAYLYGDGTIVLYWV